MYLQRIVIQGFKSFANKTTLEFKPGITAIVGPNGSGKSNIADAVRWVLGEQSLKSIRGKKSGDVIFAGSDKKTQLGYCQVDMVLNNEDRTAPLDYSEIVISRRMSRDGEGEYYINKSRVRLQDILMLLAKSNFGQRTYSIIGQGTVDAFLAATPTQRKEYFDEAAGVRQYQIKKEQAEHKLDATRDNLQQAELLIQEIEPRLRSLTRQVHRLEKREVVLKELKEIQHTYYTGMWHDLHKQLRQHQEHYQSVDQKRSGVERDMGALQKEMHELALGSSRQEQFMQLQQRYADVLAEKNKLLREQASLKGRLDSDRQQAGDADTVWLERRFEQLSGSVDRTSRSLKEAQAAVATHTATVKEAEAKRSTLEANYQKTKERLTRAKEDLASKKSITIPEIASELDSVYQNQKSVLEKIEAATDLEELRTIAADAQAVTSQLAQLRHKVQSTGTGDPELVIQLQDSIAEALQEKDALLNTIKEASIQLQVAKEKESMLSGQLDQLSGELADVEKELKRSGKSPAELQADLSAEAKDITQRLTTLDGELQAITKDMAGFNESEQEKKEQVFALQNKQQAKQQQLNELTNELNGIKVELAKLETKQEDLEREMVDELSDEERDAVFGAQRAHAAKPELFNDIQKLKKQLELIGGIDPQVAQEYKETKERFEFLTTQSTDLNKAITDLEKVISELDETIKKQFAKSFEQINKHFTEYFKILFKGGNASLSLVREDVTVEADENDFDEEDADEDDEGEDTKPTEKVQPATRTTGERVITGIDIHATPPGKRLRGISMLSGGERALTSIALLCAIIHNNPSPFVVLDEVDAALDESNSLRFASIVERLSDRTQFIIVTHNRATMNNARLIYGITMGDDGVSKLLSINMEEAEAMVNR